jgi:pyrrolidone-carboxylate peptidase
MTKDGAPVLDNVTQRIIFDVLRSWRRADCQIWVSVLPVEWRAAENILVKTLEMLPFDLAVFMGHAKGYKSLTLEARYFNKAGRADEIGKILPSGTIKSGGADFYDSNIQYLPYLTKYLNGAGIPAVVHAGPEGMDFLCNLPGYLTACYLATHGLETPKYLVIHVPDPNDLPYEISLRGIRQTIQFLSNPL